MLSCAPHLITLEIVFTDSGLHEGGVGGRVEEDMDMDVGKPKFPVSEQPVMSDYFGAINP